MLSTLNVRIGTAMIVVAAGTLLFAQARLRPGQYELTADLTIAGKPMPTVKASECLTAEDLKDQTKLLMSAADDQNCKISDLVRAGDRMTFNFTCIEDGVRFVSQAEMNYGVDSYSGVVKTTADGEVTTTRMSGKRIGDCK